MKNFRSICFIYGKQDAYEICYMEEFFKLAGFAYYAHLYEADRPDEFMENLGSSRFDIYVAANLNIREKYCDSVNTIEYGIWQDVDFGNASDASAELKKLLETITDRLFPDYNKRLLSDLCELYVEDHMAALLYEYTFTLLKTDRGSAQGFYDTVYEKYEHVLAQLDNIPVSYGDQDTGAGHDDFIEYYLFAKYHCRKNMNMLRDIRKRIEAYEIVQYLGELDQIYRYDPDFFKVEFLKAKVTEPDPVYTTASRAFFDRCIQNCPVEVCRSFFYYSLGKWLDNNEQPFEAGKAYLLSYRKAPDNIKAVFKLGIDYERKKNDDVARKYYSLITGIWSGCDEPDQIPLMELEYAFKAYKLMDRVSEGGIRNIIIRRKR